MTDAMHWSPDPPVRPEPLLRIDLSRFAADMEAARPYVEAVVADWSSMVRDAWESAITASGIDTPTTELDV